MTVFYLARAEETESSGLRVGFTVSRALGGAVDRNRMRRRLREAVRAKFPAAAVSVDVVINPKKSLRTADFSDLLKEVERAFEVIQKYGDSLDKAQSKDQSGGDQAKASGKHAL
jgi:ribonuclease P protein component